jgi:hypothetical protein
MNRLSTLIWMLVIVVAAFLLYTVKYQVQSLKTQIAETSRQLEAEKEALHVAAAEWAYLNRPERLRLLAGKYLSASEVTVDQVADIQAIPFPRQLDAADAPDTAISPVSAQVVGEAGGDQ